jgi:hypothetical protein
MQEDLLLHCLEKKAILLTLQFRENMEYVISDNR